ncbi:hypothetical protein GCM10018963_04170 [Saccharothrix longispora]|uniref:ATP-binding protein n=1 Tax=Saccharothrix longispora TaxID=33920 RepID=UPI00286C4797|nr:tetratricopeptide repeat protein [Saccharothrix longispora]
MHFHAAPHSFPTPRQLPAAISHFTDRAAHLARLDEWLDTADDRASPIEVIAGVGGVGKTSLITHWAHRVRERFSDGDLYVDLRGYHVERPVNPEDALEHVLRALDVPSERLPGGVDARAALWRSLVYRRRMLLLLDNASSAQQVRPLLPGTPTCRVVITSRSDLAGLATKNGAHRMPLDVMPPDRAADLLREVVGAERIDAEPAAVSSLIEYCGHLPLALRIAAERLANDDGARVADLVAELAEERERLDVLATPGDETATVRAVFSWSYRALDDPVARAYRLLGLTRGADIGLSAAAALIGAGEGRTRRLLAELTSVHLLAERDRRYQLHDLLRLHAAECAESDEDEEGRREAVRRLLTWYAHATAAAVHEIIPFFSQIPIDLPDPVGVVPDFADRAAALAWGDAERPNLVAAISQAARLGEHRAAWQLAVLIFGLMLVRKPHRDWVTTHEVGIDSARACGEVAAEAWLRTSAAIAERELLRFERALEHLETALVRWREDGTRWGIAWTLRDTGATYHAMGRSSEAIPVFRQALAMHLEDADTWGEATALAGLAKAHVRTGEVDLALTEARRALEIRREHDDRRNIGNALNDVAAVLIAAGEFDQAAEHAGQALRVLTEADYWNGCAVSHEILGDALAGRGQAEEAGAEWAAAARLYESLGDPRGDELRARLGG